VKESEASKRSRSKELEQEEITFPYVYTRPKGSISFKISKTPRDDYDAYTLAHYQEGLRKRVLKSTFEAALEEADEVAKLLGSKDGFVARRQVHHA
jgi:hypothetical protein